MFCRNLLIYFDRPTQSEVVEVLKRLLRLFIGPAEASLLSQHGMQPIGVPLSFVFRRTSEAPAARGQGGERRSAPGRCRRRGACEYSAFAAATGETAPAAVQPGSASQRPALASPVGEFDEIARLADAGQHREARAACERQLAARGPSATVFYWLGLLSDVAGQEQEAQDFYRKALYLEPQHAEALAHLAALLAARGDHAGARRLQQRAARGVNKDG